MPIILNQQLAPKGLRFNEDPRQVAQQNLNTLTSNNPLLDYKITNTPVGLNYNLGDWSKLDNTNFGKHTLGRYSYLTDYFADYSNLSDEDKDWVENRGNELYGDAWSKTSDENKSRLFKNNLYIGLFGLDDFKSKTPEERDNFYAEATLPYVLQGVLGNDETKSALVSNMTTQGKLDTYNAIKNNEVLTPQDLNKIRIEINTNLDELDELEKQPSNKLKTSFQDATLKVGFDEYAMLRDSYRENLQRTIGKSEAKFQDILANDTERKLTEPQVQQKYLEHKQTLTEQMREAFANQNGLQFLHNVDEELKRSNYFKAYSQGDIFNDMLIDEKIDYLAKWAALADTYGDFDANVSLESDMQKEVFNRQSGGTWLNNTLRQVGIGGVSILMQTAGGIGAIPVAAYDAIESAVSGEESKAFENYLESAFMKDASNFEKYNTFDHNIIKIGEETGGLSPYSNIYGPDNEHTNTAAQVALDAIGMTKFLWTAVLLQQIGGGALRGITSKVGAINSSLANTLNTIGSYGLVALSAAGVSEAYGYMSYENTYRQAMENIDKMREAKMKESWQRYAASEEFKKLVDDNVESAKALASLDKRTFPIFNEDFVRQETIQMIKEAFLADQKNWDNVDATLSEDMFKAKVEAANAYMMDATIEGLRMGPTNILFRDFLFDKGTRATVLGNKNPFSSNLITDAAGKLGMTNPNTIKAIKLGLGFGSGFESNFFDEVWRQASEGASLYRFNDYMSHKYGAESYYTTINDYVDLFTPNASTMSAFTEGMKKGATDPNTLQAAFVGGLAYGFGGMPNVRGIVGAILSHEWIKRKSDGNIDIVGTAAQYWKVGALDTWADLNEQQQIAQENIDLANKHLQEHWYPTLDKMSEVISTLTELNDAKQEGNVLKIKEAKATTAFQLAQILTTDDEYSSQSEVLQNYQKLLENIVNDKLSEQEKADLINQLKLQSENKSFEITDDEAINLLKKNAQFILDMEQSIADTKELLKKSNIVAKDKETQNLVTLLTYQKAMISEWEKRIKQINKEIGGNNVSYFNATNDSNTYAAVIGSKKVLEARQQSFNKIREELEKEEQSIKEEIEKLQNRFDKSTSNINKSGYQRLINKKNGRLKDIAYEKERIDFELKWLNTLNDNEFNTALTKEEILNLPAEYRAMMLDPKNLNHYSKEQQRIILELTIDLRVKNPSLLQMIQDLPILEHRVTATRRSFSALVNDVDFGLAHSILAEEARFDAYRNVNNQISLNKGVDRIYAATSQSGDIVDNIRKAAKNESSYIIKEFIKRNPEYKVILQQTLDKVEYLEKLYNVVAQAFSENQTFDSEDVVKDILQQINLFNRNIFTITHNANTADEARDALEKAIDDKDLPKEFRNQIDEILSKAEQVGMQRNSTIVQNREKREKRNKRDRERRAKEREKKRKAEEEAKNKLKKEEAEEEVKEKEGDEDKPKEIKEEVEEKVETIDTNENEEDTNLITVNENEEVAISKPLEKELNETPTNDINVSSENNAPVLGDDSLTESSSVLLGNAMRTYELGKTVQKRKSKNAGDLLDNFIKWLDDAGIKLQEIIDNEVADIKQLNQDVHFLSVNPIKNSANDAAMDNIIFLAVEATKAVKGIHKKERGGVVIANGKEYLIIGTAGYNPKNIEQQKSFNRIRSIVNQHKANYFKENDTERFTVTPNLTTRIDEIIPGRIVDTLEGEEHSQPRPLSQLLFNEDGTTNEQRNPRHLSWDDLAFGVLMHTKFSVTRKMSNVDKVFIPNGAPGNVYVMVQDSNNSWIPLEIRPIVSSEINRGKLKDTIVSLLREMTSPSIEVRKKAAIQLSNYLHFDEKNHLRYGDENNQYLAIVSNGQVLKSFTLNDAFNPNEFIQEVLAANFRINLTPKNLMSVSYLKILDEAGALSTESAMLGTHNAHYTILPVGVDGKPIISQSTNTQSFSEPIQGVGDNFRENSYMINGKTVRERNGEYYDIMGEKITDDNVIADINVIKVTNAMEPATTVNSFDIFVINGDRNNPEVVGINKNNKVVRYNKEDSLKLLDKINYEERLSLVQEENAKVNVKQKSESKQVVITENQEKDNHSKEIVLGVGKKSLKDLQNSKTFTTFVDILTKDKENRLKIRQMLEEKYGKDTLKQHNTPTKLDQFLREKDINTTDISDVDAWCEMIKNCK